MKQPMGTYSVVKLESGSIFLDSDGLVIGAENKEARMEYSKILDVIANTKDIDNKQKLQYILKLSTTYTHE